MKTFCHRCDSTGLVAESVSGSSYFEPPAERLVVCPEEGCKDGVVAYTCDVCDDDAIGTVGGFDFCGTCLKLAKASAKRAEDDMDPPDALDDVEYETARRAS